MWASYPKPADAPAVEDIGRIGKIGVSDGLRANELPTDIMVANTTAISARLLTHSKIAELKFQSRRALSRCKIRKKLARPTRFERVTFAFGAR
jgi:hypothetical protein